MGTSLYSSWEIISHVTVILAGDICININIDWIFLSVTASIVMIIRTLLK